MDKYLNKKVEKKKKIFGAASSTYFLIQENINKTVGIITNIYDNKFIELDNKILIAIDFIYKIEILD